MKTKRETKAQKIKAVRKAFKEVGDSKEIQNRIRHWLKRNTYGFRKDFEKHALIYSYADIEGLIEVLEEKK